MRSEVVKHLCVRVSAYLEQSVKRIVLSYAETKVKHSESLVNYFKKREYHEKSRNANMNYIEGLLGDLNATWKEKIVLQAGGRNGQSFLSVNAVVKLRHAVAHEGGTNTSVTFDDVKRFYSDAKIIIKELFLVCIDPP